MYTVHFENNKELSNAEMYLKFQNVTDILACKCIPGGASPGCVYGGRGQPQGSRLLPCTHTATEAWVSVQQGSGSSEGVSGKRAGKDSGSQPQCEYLWDKSWCTSARGPWQLCWPLVSSSVVKATGFLSRAGSCELQSLPPCVCYW